MGVTVVVPPSSTGVPGGTYRGGVGPGAGAGVGSTGWVSSITKAIRPSGKVMAVRLRVSISALVASLKPSGTVNPGGAVSAMNGTPVVVMRKG